MILLLIFLYKKKLKFKLIDGPFFKMYFDQMWLEYDRIFVGYDLGFIK